MPFFSTKPFPLAFWGQTLSEPTAPAVEPSETSDEDTSPANSDTEEKNLNQPADIEVSIDVFSFRKTYLSEFNYNRNRILCYDMSVSDDFELISPLGVALNVGLSLAAFDPVNYSAPDTSFLPANSLEGDFEIWVGPSLHYQRPSFLVEVGPVLSARKCWECEAGWNGDKKGILLEARTRAFDFRILARPFSDGLESLALADLHTSRFHARSNSLLRSHTGSLERIEKDVEEGEYPKANVLIAETDFVAAVNIISGFGLLAGVEYAGALLSEHERPWDAAADWDQSRNRIIGQAGITFPVFWREWESRATRFTTTHRGAAPTTTSGTARILFILQSAYFAMGADDNGRIYGGGINRLPIPLGKWAYLNFRMEMLSTSQGLQGQTILGFNYKLNGW